MGIIGQGGGGLPSTNRDTTGIIAEYQLNDTNPAATTASDTYNFGPTLTLAGDAAFEADGSGITMNTGGTGTGIVKGPDPDFAAPNQIAVSMRASGKFWIEVWCTPAAGNAGPSRLVTMSNPVVLGGDPITERNVMLGIGYTSADNTLRGRVATDDNTAAGTNANGDLNLTPPSDVPVVASSGSGTGEVTATQQHLVLTYDGGLSGEDNCFLYIDGVQVANEEVLGPLTAISWSALFPLAFGNEIDTAAGVTHDFVGKIGFVAFGDTLMSENQALVNYGAGRDGTGPTPAAVVQFSSTLGETFEPVTGSTAATVSVTMSQVQRFSVQVPYSIDPTATAPATIGVDVTSTDPIYTGGLVLADNVINIPAWSATGFANLEVHADALTKNEDERFTLTLSDPVQSPSIKLGGQSVHTHTIKDPAASTAASRPGPTNTGPQVTKASVSFTPLTASLSTTSDGQIIEGLQSTGFGILVKHNNVTIRKCDIRKVVIASGGQSAQNCLIVDCWLDGGYVQGPTDNGQQYVVDVKAPSTLGKGSEIRYCEVQGSYSTGLIANGGGAVDGIHYWHHNNIHDTGGDAMLANRNSEQAWNWIHHCGSKISSHCDAHQIQDGGSNVYFHHNFCDMPHPNNPASSSLAVDPLSVPQSEQPPSAAGSIVGGPLGLGEYTQPSNFRYSYKSNAAFLVQSRDPDPLTTGGPVDGGAAGLRIEDNWLSGGNYIISVEQKDAAAPIPLNVHVKNNIFGDLWAFGPISFGSLNTAAVSAATVVSGNTWATSDLTDMYATVFASPDSTPGASYQESNSIIGGFTNQPSQVGGGSPAFGQPCYFNNA